MKNSNKKCIQTKYEKSRKTNMSTKIKHINAKKNNDIKKTPIIYKHNKNNNKKISTLRNKVTTKIITQ